MSLSKATAAAFEVEAAGRKWTVTPPTFQDFGAFESWAERELLAQAVASGQPDAHSKPDFPRGPRAMAIMLRTIRGEAQFAWIVLRKAHPDLTLDAFAATGISGLELSRIVDAALDSVTPETSGAPAEGDKGEPFRPAL